MFVDILIILFEFGEAGGLFERLVLSNSKDAVKSWQLSTCQYLRVAVCNLP